jgi:hypothetical protein
VKARPADRRRTWRRQGRRLTGTGGSVKDEVHNGAERTSLYVSAQPWRGIMKKFLLCMALFVCWAGLANAEKFDCVNLPFGKDLSEFNQDGHFIKYREKDGVSYYNYVGPCYIEQQTKTNVAIAYGFVDNKLYARFLTIVNNEDIKADKELIAKNISQKLGSDPKTYEEGDWYVMNWTIPAKKQEYKVKFNTKTKMSKSVYYYTPLRPNESAEKLISGAQ